MAKYSVGQKVKVGDTGEIYTTYYDWATDNELSMSDSRIRNLWAKYLAKGDNDCEKDIELTVVACGNHSLDRDVVIYLCEDIDGEPILINEKGLKPVKEGLKPTDLKIGDIIRQKESCAQFMVTGIDSSETINHVFVGNYWITDTELGDNWEKV